MRMTSHLFLLFCLVLLPLWAFADDRTQAQEEMELGAICFADQRYEEALDHYIRASDFAPSAAGPHRELGKTYDALGRYEEAIREYKTYLEMKPNASDAGEIQGYLADATSKLAVQPTVSPSVVEEPIATTPEEGNQGKLSLDFKGKGAKIFVDGELVGKNSLKKPIALSVGVHRVRIERKGYQAFEQKITIQEDETTTLTPAMLSLTATSSEEQEEVLVEDDSPRRGGTLFWITGGLAVSTGIAGMFLGLDAQQRLDNLLENGTPVEFVEFQAIQDEGNFYNTLAVGGFVVGGASFAVALIQRAFSAPSKEAKLEVLPTRGGMMAGITLGW